MSNYKKASEQRLLIELPALNLGSPLLGDAAAGFSSGFSAINCHHLPSELRELPLPMTHDRSPFYRLHETLCFFRHFPLHEWILKSINVWHNKSFFCHTITTSNNNKNGEMPLEKRESRVEKRETRIENLGSGNSELIAGVFWSSSYFCRRCHGPCILLITVSETDFLSVFWVTCRPNKWYEIYLATSWIP